MHKNRVYVMKQMKKTCFLASIQRIEIAETKHKCTTLKCLKEGVKN